MNLPSAILKRSRQIETPFMLTLLDRVTDNYRRLLRALPEATVYYSVKSNNDAQLLRHLDRLGSGFDVATWREECSCEKHPYGYYYEHNRGNPQEREGTISCVKRMN